MQVCFEHRLFESLRAIADDLGSDTDPALLRKVGDFFMSNAQYDKAVHLFITCKQPGQVRLVHSLDCLLDCLPLSPACLPAAHAPCAGGLSAHLSGLAVLRQARHGSSCSLRLSLPPPLAFSASRSLAPPPL